MITALTIVGLNNEPTRERQEKSDFALKSGQWRVRTVAERLYGRGDLSCDVYNSCKRWQETYVLRTDGPGAIQNGASTSEVKHDVISFAMDQVRRTDSIPAIKEYIGTAMHNILIMSLYECMSASRIGEILLPNTPKQSRNKAVDKVCSEAYEKINEFYLQEFIDSRKKHARSM